ncbi:phosphotransferase family protein [Micromonospora zingiberis]|uniref:phosphotransferase family protein n=1 Tax=Micromonospora zingiberis TaxID=2053011 RepID=UPI0013F48103|nr:phosphotransferase family protein [Micromonospora zingiberis]
MTAAPVDLAVLARVLAEREIPVAGPLTATLVAGGKSNLTFRVTDGVNRWILRRPPYGSYHRGAHDVAREYRVLAALAATAVPVPTVVALGTDQEVPYYLMAEVPGDVLRTRDAVAAVAPADRHRLSIAMVDTLADLHEVRIDAVGLRDFGRPDGFLARQLARWHRQYHAVSRRHTVLVDELANRLGAGLPPPVGASIVHGDYRVDNLIVTPDDPGRIAAVLDWEMATLGDPLADLGTLVMFWDEVGRPFNPITGGLTAFAGFLDVDEVVSHYCARRGLDDQVSTALPWYLAFAKFKLAVILEQIHVRHTSGQTLGDGFDGIGRMVDELLDDCALATLPAR